MFARASRAATLLPPNVNVRAQSYPKLPLVEGPGFPKHRFSSGFCTAVFFRHRKSSSECASSKEQNKTFISLCTTLCYAKVGEVTYICSGSGTAKAGIEVFFLVFFFVCLQFWCCCCYFVFKVSVLFFTLLHLGKQTRASSTKQS